MDKQQYEELRKVSALPSEISASQLSNSEQDRTLLWGYTYSRDSFHVYLQNSEIHALIYGNDQNPTWYKHGESLPARDLHPDKRVYPEATDFEFACLMAKCDEMPCFTTFQEEREPQQFYGLRHDELKPTPKELLQLAELSSKLAQAIRFVPYVDLLLKDKYSYNDLFDLEKALRTQEIDHYSGYAGHELIKRRLYLMFIRDPKEIFESFGWQEVSLDVAFEEFKTLSDTLIETAEKYNDTFTGLRKDDEEKLDKVYADIEKTIGEFLTLGTQIHSSEELFAWKRED